MNRTRPQNLESIYEALANTGEDNRNDENKVYIIQTDVKKKFFPWLMNCNERDINLYKIMPCVHSEGAFTFTRALNTYTLKKHEQRGGQSAIYLFN